MKFTPKLSEPQRRRNTALHFVVQATRSSDIVSASTRDYGRTFRLISLIRYPPLRHNLVLCGQLTHDSVSLRRINPSLMTMILDERRSTVHSSLRSSRKVLALSGSSIVNLSGNNEHSVHKSRREAPCCEYVAYASSDTL